MAAHLNTPGTGNSTNTQSRKNDPLKDAEMVLKATIEQANGFSIMLALFAGVLASLAQTVAGNVDLDDSPASWKALRVFLYSAIMLNLSGAFVSLMMVKLCGDVPLAAYENANQEKPLETGKTISELLRASHVSRWYCETFTVALVTMVIFSILAINAILVFAATTNAQRWT